MAYRNWYGSTRMDTAIDAATFNDNHDRVRIQFRDGTWATYMRLPIELRRETGFSPCTCGAKGCDSTWDTLVIPDDPKARSWTCHFPDLLKGGAERLRAINARIRSKGE